LFVKSKLYLEDFHSALPRQILQSLARMNPTGPHLNKPHKAKLWAEEEEQRSGARNPRRAQRIGGYERSGVCSDVGASTMHVRITIYEKRGWEPCA